MSIGQGGKQNRIGQWIAAVLGVVLAGLVLAVEGWHHPAFGLALLLLLALSVWAFTAVDSRRKASASRHERERLRRQSCLDEVDAMTGTEFEDYIADLMRFDGWTKVLLVGGPGDGGADILVVNPAGQPSAVQCKRQVAPIPVGVIRQLAGTVAHEHPGRAGVLVTTAHLTKPAADLAYRAGITVIDRPALATWMARSRQLLEQQSPLPVSHGRHAAGSAEAPAAPW